VAREAVVVLAAALDLPELEIEIEAGMPTVQGDRIRLLEVYQNLIENAAKFMGGEPAPRIEIGAEHRDGFVVCHVRDNGRGIDAKFHDKVFGLFERLDVDVEGTGIGLALVQRIVEVHGGRVWVESEGDGKGSTFFFTLPL
jgi:signal transduction histidine kinase